VRVRGAGVAGGGEADRVRDAAVRMLHYNCAHHYALAVAILAERIGDDTP
jgi:membrane-bound lytic murein transglycosylase B